MRNEDRMPIIGVIVGASKEIVSEINRVVFSGAPVDGFSDATRSIVSGIRSATEKGRMEQVYLGNRLESAVLMMCYAGYKEENFDKLGIEDWNSLDQVFRDYTDRI